MAGQTIFQIDLVFFNESRWSYLGLLEDRQVFRLLFRVVILCNDGCRVFYSMVYVCVESQS